MLKPQRPEFVTLAVAIFIVVGLNVPFWGRLYQTVAPESINNWLFLGAIGLALVVALNLILLAFSLRPILRVLLAVLLPVTAAVSYFMQEYGVVIDINMVRNALETDSREVSDLLSLKMAGFVLLLGVLPAAIVWALPWVARPFRDDVLAKLKAAALSAVVLGVAIFPFWGEFLSVFRGTAELKLTLTPSNYIAALSKYWRKRAPRQPTTVAAVGRDAKRHPEPQARPSLFVVVVGETARADHFGLNGYARQTTPELAKIDELINYRKAYSCGTDTAYSVPCMFSGLSRIGFTNEAAAARENLLDILTHAGVDVIWRENQSGCKGVCDRVTTETLNKDADGVSDHLSETHDDVLVDGLETRIANIKRDTVIVLHMMGSHGPAYWKRYPAEFEKFTPTCKESQFSRCTTEEIVNAYDNTILYTDHVLARLIGVLKGAEAKGVEAGLMYVSDHGESLGEHNIYLHGMPYALAPEAQIHIPMVTWLSPSLRAENSIETSCLEAQSGENVSHDNLFHSVLGIMDIRTQAYDPALDIYARCTRHPS